MLRLAGIFLLPAGAGAGGRLARFPSAAAIVGASCSLSASWLPPAAERALTTPHTSSVLFTHGSLRTCSGASSNQGIEGRGTGASSDTPPSDAQLIKDHLAVERELGPILAEAKRFIREGRLNDALEAATAFRDGTLHHYGKRHPAVAAALNNLGLVHKLRGELPDAAALYAEALEVYEDVLGEKHSSTADVLTNLGVLHRTMADSYKGMEKMLEVETAVSFLERALSVRMQLAPQDDPSVCLNKIHLAAALRMQKRFTDAEEFLEEAIVALRKQTTTSGRAMLGLALNNLGFLCKDAKQFERAESAYREGLEVRQRALGPAHPETIATQHNLAELLILLGNEADAVALQQDILKKLDVDPDALK